MILPFKTHFESGKATNFPDKIIAGEKIHTIRKSGRWKAGMEMQMATGVRTKNYSQFNTNYNNLRFVTGTQKLSILWGTKMIPYVKVDGRMLEDGEIMMLAKNDGLTLLEFLEWFNTDDTDLEIIHWTDFRYGKD